MNSSQPVFGAVDIGGTKMAVGLVDDAGRILAQAEYPTTPLAGPNRACLEICRLLRECRFNVPNPLSSLGIGCTGPVDPTSGTVGDVALLPGWQGFPPCS